MKQFLRALLAWMERKFPDRVVVTTQRYQDMENIVAMHTQTMAALTERTSKLEFEVNKFNVAMGFSNTRGHGTFGQLER